MGGGPCYLCYHDAMLAKTYNVTLPYRTLFSKQQKYVSSTVTICAYTSALFFDVILG